MLWYGISIFVLVLIATEFHIYQYKKSRGSKLAFADHFKEEDKQLALNYLRTMHQSLEQARVIANAGELKTAEIHARHAVSMLEQLRTLNNAYKTDEERARLWF